VKAGQALATVHNICQVFEAETSLLARSSDVHNLPSIDEDFQLVVMDENVLQTQEQIYHLQIWFNAIIQNDYNVNGLLIV